MTGVSGRASGSSVRVGIDREVVAERRYWYLTRWVDTSSLPVRPDGRPLLLSRVVDDARQPQLAELMLARWLGRDATYWAWFDRWWRSRWRQEMYSYPDQAPLAPPTWVADRLQPVTERLGSWDGVWDAVAARPDGRLAFAEAKRRGSDSLRPSQHAFASVAAAILGDQVSFTVMEWTAAAPLDWREAGFNSEQEYRSQRDDYLSDAEFVSRWYHWTDSGQPFDRWLLSSLPQSGPSWLADHHLRKPPQHERFFASLIQLRAELDPEQH